ncbi:MAG: hypothetical protein LC772_00400 [Chloroflexi bacterium]|nr:hypothetical protein [Chloroflexota bacterium]
MSKHKVTAEEWKRINAAQAHLDATTAELDAVSTEREVLRKFLAQVQVEYDKAFDIRDAAADALEEAESVFFLDEE